MSLAPVLSSLPASIYLAPVEARLAQVLSMQDRERCSATFGCFDRSYWGWKFTDFPGARFQEGAYALAYLFSYPLLSVDYSGDERVLRWLRAALRFWRRIQYPDGSFDEAYPWEHSLAATAFTAFYIGEAYALVKDHLPAAEDASVRQGLARAGEWLCRNDERHGVLTNHLAAAAAALHVAYRACGEERFERRAGAFLQRIYTRQSKEGWYEEYGGADPGYQTHATFYLAHLWQDTGDAVLLDSLRRSLSFLKHFVHPDATLGGEYASRNTEFYFPAGFELLAGALPDAAAIAQFMRPTVARQSGVGLAAMDPHNVFPLLNNYLFAARACAPPRQSGVPPLPCQSTGEWVFPGAGLLVRSTARYFAVLGLAKGGVIKVFDRDQGRLSLSDCGYWARLDDGRIVSSQRFDRDTRWTCTGDAVEVVADFVEINQRLHRPALFAGFRLFSITLGRFGVVATWLKNVLVRALITRRRAAPLRLMRRVHFGVTQVEITDEVALTKPLAVINLRRDDKFATIHMGSSRYFQQHDLDPPPEPDENLGPKLVVQRRLTLKRSWVAEDDA